MDTNNKEILGSAIKSWIARKRYKTMIVYKSNRDKVAKEILDTEQIYVRNLETIVQFYLKPLRNINPPLLSPKSIQIIFGHIDDLLSVNMELLTSIQDRMTTWYQDKRLGDIFLKLAPYLKVYTEYCSNYDKAVARLKQKSDESKDLQIFLKKVTSENGFGLDLISLLVTPIQRIPRYKLLLQSLIQFTPVEFSDYSVLQSALDKVALVADHVNESIREKQNSEKILTIQKRFTGQCPPLLAPLRTFIREGSITKVCRKDHKKRWFILFSDALVYGNRIDTAVGNPIYKFHRLLPLANTKISNLEDSKFKNSFQIIHSIKSFTLIAENEQEKQSWLNSFNDAQNFLSRNEGSVARMNKQYSKINVLKQKEEESVSTAPVWVPDNEAVQCMECTVKFTAIRRRHHCRRCGNVVCGKCSEQKWTLDQYKKDARVCKTCFNYLSITTSRSAEQSAATTSSTSNTTTTTEITQTQAILLTGGSNVIEDSSSDSETEDNSSITNSTSDMPIINGLSSIQIDNTPVIVASPPTTPPIVSHNHAQLLPPLPVRPTSPKPFIVSHNAYNQENSLLSSSPTAVVIPPQSSPDSSSSSSSATTSTTATLTPPTLSKSNAGNNSLLDFCRAYIQASPNVSPAKVERHKQPSTTATTDSPSQTRINSTVSTPTTLSTSTSQSQSSEPIVLPELKPIASDPLIVSITSSNSTSSNSIKVNPPIQHSNSSSKLNVQPPIITAQPIPPTTDNSNNNSNIPNPLSLQTTKKLPPTPPPKKLPPTPPPKSLPPTPVPVTPQTTTNTPTRPPKPPSTIQDHHIQSSLAQQQTCISTASSNQTPSPPNQTVNSIYSSNPPAPPPKRIVSTHPSLNTSGGNTAPPLPPPRIKSQAPQRD